MNLIIVVKKKSFKYNTSLSKVVIIKMYIYLCRHGESTSDLENRYGGDYDDHLTENGREQAKRLANKFRGNGIEKIYVSPRLRAQETAQIVNSQLGVEIEIVNDLRERNQYGKLTAMNKDEAKKLFPEEVEKLKDPRNRIDGAEDFYEFKKRTIGAFEKIISEKKEKKVCIVAHGGILRRIICYIENLTEGENYQEIKVADSAVIEIDADEKRKKIVRSEGMEIIK